MRPWDSGAADYEAFADRTAVDVPERTTLLDNAFAQFDATRAINASTESRSATYGGPYIEQRAQQLEQITGLDAKDWALDAYYAGPWADDGAQSMSRRRSKLLQMIDAGVIQRSGPGSMKALTPEAAGYLAGNESYAERLTLFHQAVAAGQVQSDAQIAQLMQRDINNVTARAETIAAGRPGFGGALARFGGAAPAAIGNILEQAGGPESLLLGGAVKGGAKTLAGRALQAFGREGAIAGAQEIPVQADALRFNRNIGVPYTGRDAALNVLAATLGGGILGAGVPLVGAGAKFTAEHAKAVAGRVRERFAARPELQVPDLENAVRTLEDYAGEAATAPKDAAPHVEAAHSASIGKAADDLLAEQPVNVEAASAPVREAAGVGPVMEQATPESAPVRFFDQRLDDPRVRVGIENMAREAGWFQVGGEVVREAAPPSTYPTKGESAGRPTGEVVGRTPWVPNAPWFPDVQRNAPLKGNVNGEATEKVVRKALAGQRLGAAERRHVTLLLDTYESWNRAVDEAGAAAGVPDINPFDMGAAVAHAGLSPHDAAGVALVTRAIEIDEIATERAAIELGDNDAAFMARIQEIIANGKTEKAAQGGKEAPGAAAGEGAAGPAGEGQQGAVAPHAANFETAGAPGDVFSAARKSADLFVPDEAEQMIAKADELVAEQPERPVTFVGEDGAVHTVRASQAMAELDAEARALDAVTSCAFPKGI